MTNSTGFLPENYEAPKGVSDYAKLEKGKNKFRLLSKPVMGWLDWQDKKPLRFLMNEKPEKPVNPNQAVKFFWSLIAWNYQTSRIQIIEITQRSIQAAVEALAKDADWGNPFNYDINITKEGDGMETEYTVNPVPHKPVATEIIAAFKAKPCYLPALFQGADPFINHGSITPLNDELA